jgi:hypothetical protein
MKPTGSQAEFFCAASTLDDRGFWVPAIFRRAVGEIVFFFADILTTFAAQAAHIIRAPSPILLSGQARFEPALPPTSGCESQFALRTTLL